MCNLFMWTFGASMVWWYYVANFGDIVDPQVWAKEWVLNKEKFRVPDKATPFQGSEDAGHSQ